MEFRLLRADEIECRIATVKKPEGNSKGGVSLLLYKDARCDQNLLDEIVKPMNWQRSHQLIGDRLYCTVSIWDEEKKQWISKQDVGTESYTEKEKGQASDSFKRACFNWGIGRELYSAPFIWITGDKCTVTNDNKCYDKFEVSEIGYDDKREINSLVIIDSKTKDVVYSFGSNKKPVTKKTESKKEEPKTEEKKSEFVSADQVAELKEKMKADGVTADFILNSFGIKSFKEMTVTQFENTMNYWSRVLKKFNEV